MNFQKVFEIFYTFSMNFQNFSMNFQKVFMNFPSKIWISSLEEKKDNDR
jgi:hypothetical protein